MSISSAEGRLPLVSLPYSNPIICISKVQLREDSALAESIQRFADKRKEITVFNRDFV